MRKYKVICRIESSEYTQYITCREMTIDGGSYCFWKGEYGQTNELIWAFPISRTIVEFLSNETNK